MRRIIFIATISCCFVIFPAYQQEDLPTPEEILDQMQRAGETIKSFRSNFYQVEINEFGEQEDKKGNAFFLKPGRYLLQLEVEGKIVEEVGKNHEVGWRIRHSIKKVEKMNLSGSNDRYDGEVELFSEPEELKEKFEFSLVGRDMLDSVSTYHLSGIPKRQLTVQKIELWVDVDNPAPALKMVIFKRRGAKTTFSFSNINRDVDVDENKFVYRVPSGYEEQKY